MEIRPTTTADLPACFRVFRAAISDVYVSRNLEPPSPPEHVWADQQRHLLANDAERCFVAEEDGRVVAFAASWLRGDAWFLASLFVEPAVQARGIGGALLDATWSEGTTRRTLTDAIQPVSNGLYAARGLIPWTPLLAFSGEPRTQPPPALEPAEPTEDALRGLDVAAYGFDRSVDHAYWRREGTCKLWVRHGEPVGYAYAWPHGQVGPLAAVDAGAAGDVARAELARAAGPVTLRAPGSSTAVVAAAVEAGLRLAPTPGLLLLSDGAPPPRALAISSYTLY